MGISLYMTGSIARRFVSESQNTQMMEMGLCDYGDHGVFERLQLASPMRNGSQQAGQKRASLEEDCCGGIKARE